MSEEKLLTSKQVAKILDCAVSTVNLYCRDGRFPNAKKITQPTGSEYWLIPESDFKGLEIKNGRPKKDKPNPIKK